MLGGGPGWVLDMSPALGWPLPLGLLSGLCGCVCVHVACTHTATSTHGCLQQNQDYTCIRVSPAFPLSLQGNSVFNNSCSDRVTHLLHPKMHKLQDNTTITSTVCTFLLSLACVPLGIWLK